MFDGIDDPEIEEARRSLSEMYFMQEFGAEFTKLLDEGRVYPDFSEDIHVKDSAEMKDDPRWKNFWAFDFGMSNPTVCLDIQVDTWDNVYVWREYYERGKPAVMHAKALRARQNPPGWRVSGMFGDPSAAGDIATFNLLLGNVIARRVPWEQGVEEIKRLMIVHKETKQPRLFVSNACPTDPRVEHVADEGRCVRGTKSAGRSVSVRRPCSRCTALFCERVLHFGGWKELERYLQQQAGSECVIWVLPV